MLSPTPSRLFAALLLVLSVLGAQVPAVHCASCCHLLAQQHTSYGSEHGMQNACPGSGPATGRHLAEETSSKPVKVQPARIHLAVSDVAGTVAVCPAMTTGCPATCGTTQCELPNASSVAQTFSKRDQTPPTIAAPRTPVRFTSLYVLAAAAPALALSRQGSPQVELRLQGFAILRI